MDTEALRQKMVYVIEHFDQRQVTNNHCFCMFGGVINGAAVQKTMMLIFLSCALIALELVVASKFDSGN